MTTTELGKARERLQAVDKRARAIYDALDPISARYEFEKAPSASETAGAPLVLILGNHSSGKSTFVNHLLGEEVQKSGIAPTDDGFTIIAHGNVPDEKDGAAVISNPQQPYGDLERFGPKLVSHLKLKVRPSPILEGLSLVDSPGMIDAADDKVGRGYDFHAVARWFAERADVVLLLFDPDKPGTTGETLKVLTTSLDGLDHKLLIVLNKVDLFGDIHDFARTYGALCWNLSKCIPHKDLPHIYNMFVPVPQAPTQPKDGLPRKSFEEAREEVMREIKRAPLRRVDNIVSRLYEHARRLRVHAIVCDRARRETDGVLIRFSLLAFVLAVSTLGLGYGVNTLGASGGTTAIVLAAGAAIAAGVFAFARYERTVKARDVTQGVDAVFERAFERDLALGDRADDLRALWKNVRERTRRALVTVGATSMPRLHRGEHKRLDGAIEHEIPSLRSEAAS